MNNKPVKMISTNTEYPMSNMTHKIGNKLHPETNTATTPALTANNNDETIGSISYGIVNNNDNSLTNKIRLTLPLKKGLNNNNLNYLVYKKDYVQNGGFEDKPRPLYNSKRENTKLYKFMGLVNQTQNRRIFTINHDIYNCVCDDHFIQLENLIPVKNFYESENNDYGPITLKVIAVESNGSNADFGYSNWNPNNERVYGVFLVDRKTFKFFNNPVLLSRRVSSLTFEIIDDNTSRNEYYFEFSSNCKLNTSL